MEVKMLKDMGKYITFYFGVYLILIFLFPFSRTITLEYYLTTAPEIFLIGVIGILLFSVLASYTTVRVLEYSKFLLTPQKIKAFYISVLLLTLGSYYLMFSTNSLNIPSYVEMNTITYSLINIALVGPLIPLIAIIMVNIKDIVKSYTTTTSSTSASLVSAFSLGCPSCGAVLFSLIGMPFALALLPLKGIELKIISLFALLYAITSLKSTCEECKSSSSRVNKNLYFFLASLLFIFVTFNYALTSATLYDNPYDAMKELSLRNLDNVDIMQSQSTLMSIALVFPELKKAKTQQEVIDILIPTGTPPYASAFNNQITFDDPVKSLNFLAKHYFTLKKEVKDKHPEAWERYVRLASSPLGISCEFCCGVGPAGSDENGNLKCGCQHNPALQAIALGLLAYTDMSDAEVIREVLRWKSVFFPRDMVRLGIMVSQNEDISQNALPGMVGGC